MFHLDDEGLANLWAEVDDRCCLASSKNSITRRRFVRVQLCPGSHFFPKFSKKLQRISVLLRLNQCKCPNNTLHGLDSFTCSVRCARTTDHVAAINVAAEIKFGQILILSFFNKMLGTIERPDGFTIYRRQHFSLFSFALSQITCKVCGHFENIPFIKQ